MINEEFLALASEEAKKGYKLDAGLPFGAVIAKEGRFLVSAHNECRKKNDPTAHSDLLAIRKARRMLGPNLRGSILYTTCKPCRMCIDACVVSEIDMIIYLDTKSASKSQSAKKWKQIVLRTVTNNDAVPSPPWKRSVLRQVESDERDMMLISSRPMRRNSSQESTTSTISSGSSRSSTESVWYI